MFPSAVFFDLDGTLADTAIDLRHALNQVLEENNYPLLSLDAVRTVASNGSHALIKTGFQIEKTHPLFSTYQQRFLEIYRNKLTDHPVLMDGMALVMAHIASHDIAWGIVTNKPAWLTDPLVEAMDFPSAPACVVSGDTAARGKPYPDSLLYACQCVRVNPAQCLYIGDAQRDIQAGKAAGMHTVAAEFGYLAPEDNPQKWGADHVTNLPQNLSELILTHINSSIVL